MQLRHHLHHLHHLHQLAVDALAATATLCTTACAQATPTPNVMIERRIAAPEALASSQFLSSISLGSASAELMAHDWRGFATRMRDWARGQAERVRKPGAPGSPVAPAAPEPPLRPMPAVVVPPSAEPHNAIREVQVRAPRGPGGVSPLPSQDVEGLRAAGQRTTWTVEAGKLGNDKPIVSSREVWTSPELMLTLRSVEIDPRLGETHYKLQNLKRGEPDAALMRVPADDSKPRSAGVAGEKPAS